MQYKDSTFSLKDSFVSKYQGKQPQWGPLGYFTYKRTYSRPLTETKSEEFWQTIQRVVEGCFVIQKQHCNENHLPWNERKAQKSAQEMFQRMWDFKFLPPGRGLWAMGTDFVFKKGSAALNNCFPIYEKFFIKDSNGKISLTDFSLENKVTTISNSWENTIIKSFGIQDVYELELKPDKSSKTKYRHIIHTTKNHKWILEDGSTTTTLKVGDKIKLNKSSQNIDKTNQEYIDGFIHGAIFGDGTKHTKYPYRQFIQVCCNKLKEKEDIFKSGTGFLSKTGTKSRPVFTFINHDTDMKTLPTSGSFNYMVGFLEGWIAADGHNRKKSICLDTQNKDAVKWLIDWAGFLGYPITGLSVENYPTNYGERKSPLNRIKLNPLINSYIVKKITYLNTQEVRCVTVPSGRFTLASGILTGNCGFISTKDINQEFSTPFIWLMDMSMHGVGVGFDTLGASREVHLKPPRMAVDEHSVDDSREGWVDATKRVLDAYTGQDSLPKSWDYSKIRPAGELIKGFGGIAPGPQPLIELINNLISYLNTYVKNENPIDSTAIVDIMNFIGAAVVSGGIRRSSEIALGSMDDVEFQNLKTPDENNKIPFSRWASNNSLVIPVGVDYTQAAQKTAINGEPGYFWIDNARKFGRMKDLPDNKDYRIAGTNPCGEQSLEPFELCNLVETFPVKHENKEDYLRTLKFAYLYAKSVTLLPTHDQRTNAVMLRNRRIGTSQSGIINQINKVGFRKHMEWCDEGYNVLNSWDKIYSEWLCVSQSIKKTTVKPSGTVSLLVGVNPGIHYPHSEYYLRRIRVAKNSNLWKIMEDAGYPVEPDVNEPDYTMVVSFPVREEFFSKKKNDVSIWEQLELAAQMQYYWSDNQVSITVTVKPEESKLLANALSIYETRLKSVSFLPIDGGNYKQPPYEEISEDIYLGLIHGLKKVKFNLSELDDGKVIERFCDGDVCTIT